jgi:hypothetical protein
VAGATYHVNLTVSHRKVDWCTCAIILGQKVRVRIHDASEFLRIARPHASVKSEGLVFGGRRVATRASHVAWHLELFEESSTEFNQYAASRPAR